MSKKILITGGSGFLGSNLCDLLSNLGYEVIIYDKIKPKKLKHNQRYISGNLLKLDKLKKIYKSIDYVFHFAGMADIELSNINPLDCLNDNIIGTANILKLFHNSKKLKRFVFASTIYIYSKKGGFYKTSKLCSERIIEQFAENYNLKYTVLRFGSIYGPDANEFNWINNILKDAIKNKKIVRFGNGEEIRNYIHVKDAANLCYQVILNKKYENEFIIIKGIESVKIKDLLTMIKEIFNNQIKIIYKTKSNSDHYDVTPYSYNQRIAKQIIPDNIIDLGEGLLECIDYINKNQ